ncbi:S-layer protein [bacterium]|nr:S-layer protein [bacterium]|tara:strand:+ start:16257 stop:17123 length:867 start_codon:yes stop_codon:yes gene_type:complete
MYVKNKQRLLLFTFILLTLATAAIWAPILTVENKSLTVSFLNVGQGDAIFIQTPSGRQVVIDGGQGNVVLRELGEVMPFFDRSLDIVIATHPDADHIGGLSEILKRYDVQVFMRPGVAYDTPAMGPVITALKEQGIQELFARRGQQIDFGDGVYLTILLPDRDVLDFDPNEASIVLKVEFENRSFLFTGDSPVNMEEYLVSLDGEQLASDVLKIGHHGSKTSSSELLVGYVDPDYGVLSRGCENSYGHPSQEVLGILSQFEIQVLDTCNNGRITFQTDGSVLYVESAR